MKGGPDDGAPDRTARTADVRGLERVESIRRLRNVQRPPSAMQRAPDWPM